MPALRIKCRIGGEAFDQRILIERQDAVDIGAIGEYLDVLDDLHGSSLRYRGRRRITADKSTTTRGCCRQSVGFRSV